MEMKIIIPVIYMCIFVVVTRTTTGELIKRTNCPTETERKSRSTEFCEYQPQNYHCIYNRDCQLVEFCAEAKYNNFEIYLKDSGQTFLTERQNKMYTNSMEYSIIQYNIYCKPKIPSTTEKSAKCITEQPTCSTTVDETPFHCYAGWILFGLSLVVIVFFIYFTCKRKGNSETPRETVTQGQTGGRVKYSTPVLEATLAKGGTKIIESHITRKS